MWNKTKQQPQQGEKLFMTKDQVATIFVVVITAFLTTFTASALNLSIPAIDAEFKAGATSIGWVINGYILASAAFSVPFGRIADLTQRRLVLITGILTFALCTGAINFAWSIQVFIFLRVLQGIGAAMIFSTNQAVLISAFSPERRGKVLGYSIASTYTGLTAGPVVGGLMNHTFGWRSIFILIFVISIFVFLIAWKKLPRTLNEQENKSMDLLGSILYVAMIVSLMVGFSAVSATSLAGVLIPIGVILLVLFLFHEKRNESPIIQVRLFTHNTSYLFSNLAALLNYGATFALGYLLSIYLQMVKGYGSEISGMIMISQPLIMALLSPYAGRLSDRISPFKLASFGMALCTLGLFSFIFVSEEYPLALIIANLVVVGLGFAFFSSPNTNAVMACVEPKDYGVATSILSTMRTIGHSLSMAVVSFVVAKTLGNVVLADAETSLVVFSMRITFLIFTVLSMIGVFISLKRKTNAP
jgi:EmrB/QacA subfamily drug resistance transporter